MRAASTACTESGTWKSDGSSPTDLAHKSSGQVAEIALRPVHVLDQHDNRPLGDEPVEEVDPRVMEALARDERVQVFGWRQADGEAKERVVAEPLGNHLGRIALEDPEVLLEHLGERLVRDALAVGEAAARAAQRRQVLRREPLPQLTDEARLP